MTVGELVRRLITWMLDYDTEVRISANDKQFRIIDVQTGFDDNAQCTVNIEIEPVRVS